MHRSYSLTVLVVVSISVVIATFIQKLQKIMTIRGRTAASKFDSSKSYCKFQRKEEWRITFIKPTSLTIGPSFKYILQSIGLVKRGFW